MRLNVAALGVIVTPLRRRGASVTLGPLGRNRSPTLPSGTRLKGFPQLDRPAQSRQPNLDAVCVGLCVFVVG